MDRRDFVLRTAAATMLGGTWSAGCAGHAGDAQDDGLSRIGLQLYTVREMMRGDVEGTLTAVAALGYQEVEFAGYFGHDPTAVRTMLERSGLRAPATHLPIDAFREDRDGTIARGLEIGHEYLIVPSLPSADRVSLDGFRRIAAEFNEIGRACREQGVRFGYHNHDFEFRPIDGRIPYDILVDESEPDLVRFELDLFWIRNGGQDALAYIQRFPNRFELCHVKDMNQDGEMVDVGDGLIDFGAIFAQAPRAGLRHYFVEHDNPVDALESIRKSYGFLQGLRF